MPRHTPLTAEFVRAVLDYDPLTGVLTWRYRPDMPKRWNTRYAGKPAGYTTPQGYIVIQIGKRVHYPAHQLAWVHFHGVWPENEIDHRYGVRNDNRINELREATDSENGCNKVMQRNNKSGFVGVHFDSQRGKYRSSANIGGRRYDFGFFNSAEEGAAARQRGIDALHGDFAVKKLVRKRYFHSRDH